MLNRGRVHLGLATVAVKTRDPAVRSKTGLRTGLWSGPRSVWSAVVAELETGPAVWSLVLAAWDRWCWSQTGLNRTGPLVGRDEYNHDDRIALMGDGS
jgi:hypothetical protein